MKHQNKPLCRLLLITLTASLCCLINTTSAQTVPEIAEKALGATVYLEMYDSNDKTLGIGSGFFIRKNQIATNYHVIKGAMRGTAKLVGKSTTYIIEGVTATDKTNDLVILKVTASGVKSLPLGDSDVVRIGEAVYVAGNPKGLEGTFSNGIISSLRDRSTKERLQMTAPISPGSSGGPVLNSKGEVIGVSFMTLVGGQNLNFAIPVNILKELLGRSGAVIPFTHVDPIRFAEVYLRWGKKKYELGNYENAIADYDRAILLNPDHADVYNNRGNAKYKLGQHNAAIADYDRAILLNPDHAKAYNNRGNVKYKLERYFAAIADYDRAILLNPDHADVYNNRGNAKHKFERYSAAITDYDTAIRLKPNFAFAYIRRGFVKEKLGQHNAAIADYDTAIQLKPDFAFAYYNRGSVNALLERTHKAKQDLRTALALAEKSGSENIKILVEKALRSLE